MVVVASAANGEGHTINTHQGASSGPVVAVVSTDRVIADVLAHACAAASSIGTATSREPRGELPDDLDAVILDVTTTATAAGWSELSRTRARIILVGDTAFQLPAGVQAHAWLASDAAVEQLIDAITGVGSASEPSARSSAADPLDDLTPREREVLTELLSGDPVPAIGQRLDISEHTVRTHVQNVMSKLGVNSRAEAASLAIRYGLVTSDATTASA